ncbi:MAG TPA: hypothetical protein VFL80_01540 [Thermoanaerobaculia bacterium]|nr:hypothetical protein [Thermoanaerobaculia bacterium]
MKRMAVAGLVAVSMVLCPLRIEAETRASQSNSDPITIVLERVQPGPDTISFGLPLRRDAVVSTGSIAIAAGGSPLPATIKPLLYHHDANGDRTTLRAVLVQLPASVMTTPSLTITVTLNGSGPPPPSTTRPFEALSFVSPENAPVVDRTIVNNGGVYRLQESNPRLIKLFDGRLPAVLAHFPPGYVAQTGILGPQVSASEVASDASRAGIKYLSEALMPFVKSSYYEETYRLNATMNAQQPLSGSIVDPVANFEGWLYDRCATLLTASSHSADPTVLPHALRTCSYYSGKIALTGENRGIYIKNDPDLKYSHLRGVFAYYALTGDEGALASGRAMAEMWKNEPLTIGPYRQGHLRGPDRLWTERLLGTGLEGLYYGFLFTDDKAYLTAFRETLDTAYRHITTSNQAELVAINLDPNVPPFPPQNCFVHNAEQHAEADRSRPWCSGWMSELVIDPLLAYQEQTDDPRVDEIFVRLTRFLRDVGSSYFQGNVLPDTFLRPSICFDTARGQDTRMLVPLYGAGVYANGQRYSAGDYNDFEHCTDATALTAVGLRALARQGKLNQGGPIGPFASEGAALLQLHHEFAFCSQMTFAFQTRLRRDPATWSSAELAAGAADPARFILDNRIGFPSRPSNPQRKLSWWFNTSMLQFALLREAGIAVPQLRPGVVQPQGQGCPVVALPPPKRRAARHDVN